MYSNYFGLNQKPFEVSPDPDFLYFTSEHREVLASLIYGIRQRRGFITVIGEVGTGKTTILNTLLQRLGASHRCAFVFYGGKSFQAFLNDVLVQLRLADPPSRLSVQEAIQRLHDFARQQYNKGGNVVLIIDEAQNLNRDLLEQIRLLSNLETRKHKLIQIVLSGQVELDDHLNRYDLRQLSQRINLKRYITALDYKDTLAYIQHRIQLAGYHGPALFTEQALRLIRMESGGIPRKINILCDNALITAYGLNKKQIDTDIIREVVDDLRSAPAIGRVVKTKCKQVIQQLRNASITKHLASGQRKILGRMLIDRSAQPIRHRFTFVWGLLLIIGIGFFVWPFFHRNLSASTQKIQTIPIHTEIKETITYPIASLDVVSGPPQKEISENDATEPKTVVSTIQKQEIEEIADPKRIGSLALSTDGTTESSPDPIFIIAKKGDTLAAIIRTNYGVYNEKILVEILKANRTIDNVRQIRVGQVILLPHLKSSAFYFSEKNLNPLSTSQMYLNESNGSNAPWRKSEN